LRPLREKISFNQPTANSEVPLFPMCSQLEAFVGNMPGNGRNEVAGLKNCDFISADDWIEPLL
jgi:hypothetical protein